MKHKTKWNRKLKEIKELVLSAMTDKPIWKPAQGLSYIKDVPVGNLVKVGNQTAIVVEHTEVSTVIHCVEYEGDDKSFYIGKHRWSNQTEVQTI